MIFLNGANAIYDFDKVESINLKQLEIYDLFLLCICGAHNIKNVQGMKKVEEEIFGF